jgi:hypothetical protein
MHPLVYWCMDAAELNDAGTKGEAGGVSSPGNAPATSNLGVPTEPGVVHELVLPPRRRGFFRRAVLFPDRYVWYVFASTLDIIVTVTVLKHLGFREANSFAQKSIDYFGTWGLIGLKFISVILVVVICEYVGRHRERVGRTLATLAIMASLFPVAFAMIQLLIGMAQGLIVHTEWPRHDLPGH